MSLLSRFGPGSWRASPSSRRLPLTQRQTVTSERLPPPGSPVPLALAAASVVLAGVTLAAVHLLDQVATSGDTGTALAWEPSIPIDQRQVHGDMAVTLARGYVDTGRVVLGLSSERASGWGPTGMMNLELRDPAGVVLPAGGGPGFGGEGGGGLIDTAGGSQPGALRAYTVTYTARLIAGRIVPILSVMASRWFGSVLAIESRR